MLRTGGMVAISMGALLTAGSMNLAVLNGGPSGPGDLVLRAASRTTTTRAAGHSAQLASVEDTTSTTSAHRGRTLHRASAPDSTTTSSPTTTSTKPSHPTTTTTRPPVTTTTQPPKVPEGARVFFVRNAGRVNVRWVTKRTISATAEPNPGWTLPHSQKQGPDVTLRFSSKTQLVVWHAWVEAHQIKAWIHTYNLGTKVPQVPGVPSTVPPEAPPSTPPSGPIIHF